jgi:hypothetical protein
LPVNQALRDSDDTVSPSKWIAPHYNLGMIRRIGYSQYPSGVFQTRVRRFQQTVCVARVSSEAACFSAWATIAPCAQRPVVAGDKAVDNGVTATLFAAGKAPSARRSVDGL